ncbi:hypothetical protein EYZ11_011005 [Aspergillus tanneri]|uniref:Uncharacterized protein n=1 Tax=Aspergillus tanneri TaxID=1220188 RepID=A0A4S3J3Z3_9EURO|nr:hypothetical protein EYZ11_011005 [Aspergillus tanneri]
MPAVPEVEQGVWPEPVKTPQLETSSYDPANDAKNEPLDTNSNLEQEASAAFLEGFTEARLCDQQN